MARAEDILKVLDSPHTESGEALANGERLTVSLKTLAQLLDAHRSSVRRWLRDAGVRPVSLGRGRNGAIRYRWRDIEAWLASRASVE